MREIYSILYKATHKAPSGASSEQIADAIGTSQNFLNQRVNPDYPLRHFYIEDIPAFVAVTGDDTPLHFLCEQCGGEFLRMPKVEAKGVPVHVACMDSGRQFGELMTECSQALADGRITLEESDQLAHAGYEAIHEILRLLKTAEREAK